MTEDSGDVVTATVRADGAGYVVVADAMQWGWRAEVDGAPAPLHRADHAFVAVAVPAGDHVVSFRHDPPGWSVGLRVSLAAAVALLGAIAVGVRRRRGHGRGGPADAASAESAPAPLTRT